MARVSRWAAGDDDGVIHDVDESLRTFLLRCLPDGARVEFTTPRVEQPDESLLLNGFLYDIREDLSSLTAYSDDIRAIDGSVAARRMPIRRYRLRYLFTAWSGSAAASEHQLLGAVLAGCVQHQTMPADCLAGSLADTGHLVTLRCAPSDEEPVGIDPWVRLGVPPRTILDLVVIAPLIPPAYTDLADAPSEFALRPSPQRRQPPQTPQPGRRPKGRVTEPS
ncbi:MAG TPA: Pvc16 family protein [Pseudonocardiaceae bacterium]|nr:Pvc16 family protein [Pseudonocardiaceae bacterium]